MIKKIGGLLIGLLIIISCSSLPTKEVELAKKELDQAKMSEADKYAPYDYQAAEENYNKADSFIKEKKGDEAKKHAEISITNSRKSLIASKDKRTKEAIDKLEGKINSIKSMEYTGEVNLSKDIAKEVYDKLDLINKVKPYEDRLKEAKTLYDSAKDKVPAIEKNINKTEDIKELSEYIKLMDEAYNKATETEKELADEMKKADSEFKEKFESAMILTDLNTKVSKGNEVVEALNKDEFVNTFYKQEKDEAIAEFMGFKEAVQNNDVILAQNHPGFDKLMAFYNKMVEEKESLRITFSLLTQKLVDKANGFYKKEAESYLEKAERLRKEVYKLYGKEMMQDMKPNSVKSLYIAQSDEEKKEENNGIEDNTNKDENSSNTKVEEEKVEKKEEVAEEKADEEKKEGEIKEENKEEKEKSIEENKKEKAKKAETPEDAMLNQLDYLYENATAEYEKENYFDSIERAKEAIELAEKMIALKKGIAKKEETDKIDEIDDKSGIVIKGYKKYVVVKGDCLWKIAMRSDIYGKAYLWPIIWYANKELIKNPHIIEPKMEINIPIFK